MTVKNLQMDSKKSMKNVISIKAVMIVNMKNLELNSTVFSHDELL